MAHTFRQHESTSAVQPAPCAESAPRRLEPSRRSLARPMSKLTVVERNKLNLAEASILLAGGNPVEVDLLVQVFTGFGAIQLHRAKSVAAAREACKAPTDLLVMDAMLGAEDCFALVRWMRRAPGDGRFRPIILTAANASPSLIAAARDSGVNYVVAKPLTPRVLFERLLYVVREARPFVESPSYAGPDRRFHKLGPPSGGPGRRFDDPGEQADPASDPDRTLGDAGGMKNLSRSIP